jgi:tight adherence protein B
VRRACLTLALTALAAIAAAAPAAADLGMSPARDTSFPYRSYVLTVPPGEEIVPGQVHVTENGKGVSSASLVRADDAGSGGSVQAAGGAGSDFGVVLVIDASSSMRGEPIEAAIAAAREFAERRTPNQSLAIVAFNSERTVTLLEPTTDAAAIDAALAQPPEVAGGTHAYDAVDSALTILADAKIAAGSVILLSDGADNGSQLSLDAVTSRARDEGIRIYSVGLRSRHYDPGALLALARDGQGEYAQADSASDLSAIYGELAARIANQYLLSYRSLEQPGKQVSVSVAVDGVGTASDRYTTPALGQASRQPAPGGIWTSGVMLLVISFGSAALFGLVVVAILSLIGRRRRVEGQMAAFLSSPEFEGQFEARRGDRAGVLADGAERKLSRLSWWPGFKEQVDLANLKWPAVQIAAATAAASLGCLVLFWAASGPLLGIASVAIPPIVTRTAVRFVVAKQRRLFAEQLADNLQVIASAMRAGNSFVGALSVSVQDAAEPAKRELQRAVTDERLGVPFDEALRKVQTRMENKDLAQVILVAALQRETGGNTAEILDRVADTIRERMELRRFVRVLTAQGRLARVVVTSLPIGLALLISVISPDYLDPLFATTTGLVMCGVAGALLAMAWMAINRIIDIKV